MTLLKAGQKIEVFVRHCHYSEVSAHKKRFSGYSTRRCFENLISTSTPDKVSITFLLDTFYPMQEPHFLTVQRAFPVVSFKGGTETASFLYLLDYVASLNLSPKTIVYFLEEDYLHRPDWARILQEGFSIPGVDYVTLYDHRDKYTAAMYADLTARLFCTPSCHWRTTPSTTNTYAMRFGTLIRDMQTHRAFSLDCRVSRDHEKFCALREKGALLISSVPGFSTHAEPAYASPCHPWGDYFFNKE